MGGWAGWRRSARPNTPQNERSPCRPETTDSRSRSRRSTARAARRRTTRCCARSSRWASRSRGRTCSRRNIAGLPTWFTIRANKRRLHRARKEIDVLVAMNPETARRGRRRDGPGRVIVLNEEALGPARCRRTASLYAIPFSKLVEADRRRREAAQARRQHDLRRRGRRAARRSTRARSSGRSTRSSARSPRRSR